MDKIKKALIFLTIGAMFILLFLRLYPQFFFANKIDYKCFTVYYHDETNSIEDIYTVLDKSEELLKTSELFDNSINQKLFLCSGFSEFTFFAPLSRKAFAINTLLSQHVFLTKSNIPKDLIIRNGKNNSERTLSGVIAHETVHSLLTNKLGLIKYKLLPPWKNEGYSDYIANGSSYDTQKGLKDICSNKESSSTSFKYFKYRLFIEYLFEEEQLSIDQVLNKEFDVAKVEEKLKNRYCSK